MFNKIQILAVVCCLLYITAAIQLLRSNEPFTEFQIETYKATVLQRGQPQSEANRIEEAMRKYNQHQLDKTEQDALYNDLTEYLSIPYPS